MCRGPGSTSAIRSGASRLRKLASLGEDAAQCRALLRRVDAGDVRRPAPPKRTGLRLRRRHASRLGADRFHAAGLVTSCSVAAAMHLFETRVIAAGRASPLRQPVVAIDHAGSYSCRRLYGRADGAFSEHATADAIDILGFRLADGTRVSVLDDWSGDGPKAAVPARSSRRRLPPVRDRPVARLQCRARRSSASSTRRSGEMPAGAPAADVSESRLRHMKKGTRRTCESPIA